MAQTRQGPTYRPDIDGLRAIAVLSVVIYHAFPKLVRNGYTGVDIFFVISGYLISRIIFNELKCGRFNFLEFYARRVRRIFPALLLTLLATYVVGGFMLFGGDFRALGRHIWAGAAFYSNFVLWFEVGYFQRAAATTPLLHLWSLGIEEQFYIVWPLMAYGLWKLRAKAPVVLLLLIASSFAYSIYQLRIDPPGAFYLPVTRFWELMLGALLAFVRERPIASIERFENSPDWAKWREATAWTGLVLIVLALYAPLSVARYPGWGALLPTMGCALLIAAGSLTRVNQVLSAKILVWFGLISYPLYLWHWPILSFLRISQPDPPPHHERFIAVAVSIVLAWLTYRYVERYMRHGANRGWKAGALALSMAGVVALGLWTQYEGKGAFGLRGDIRHAVTQVYDFEPDYRHRTCFLDRTQTAVNFDGCTQIPTGVSSGHVLLWGDSHGGHLHPGVRDVLGPRFTITQFTSGGCPPLLGSSFPARPNCAAVNAHVFKWIEENRPDRILLAAYWGRHDWSALPETIAWLRARNIKQIDVVGPVPTWELTLPKFLLKHWHQQPEPKSVPRRLKHGVLQRTIDLDLKMREIVPTLGARYISSMDIFCNQDGCLTLLGPSPGTLTTYDGAHLTGEGSRFLVSGFPP